MFVFSLEAVLKARIRKVEQAQLALARSQRAVQDIETRLAGNTGERRVRKEELRDRSAAGISADEFIVRRRHLNGLRVEGRRLTEELSGVLRVVDQRREELVAADREKKMVERLKEKARERYAREAKAREMKALDEFAVLGFARARRGGHA